MNHRHRASRIALAVALAFALHVPAAAQDAAHLEKRLAAISILVDQSSAARQVDASGDARALERREQARSLYRQALASFQRGDHAKAAALANDASTRMLEAVRLAAPEQVNGPKRQTDYEARLESVRALAAAHKRIAAEKAPDAREAAETSRTLDRLVAEAQAQAEAKNFAAAAETLDRAYHAAKAAVASMRGGDTLVRSLSFASREEEYRYELDRNDTHDMLVKLLLKDKPLTGEQRGFMERARALRAQAEAAARGGDHGGAVRLLEDATRELVRAIRLAGVFIPG